MESTSWSAVLGGFSASAPLAPDMANWAMTQILSGQATDAQTAAFAMGLHITGETSEQVAVLAATMLEFANLVPAIPGISAVVDVVGTGGDGSHSVNISTMGAVVAAACGVTVIKHGNRAFSSSTGSADLLEALGLDLDLSADQVAAVAQIAGIAFCFAPNHHPAMRFAAPARTQLGIPTVFNILGPLTNPALANAALVGCAHIPLAPVMARVLASRGVRALVVRGTDGLDEISLSAPTQVWDATSGEVVETRLDPADFGIIGFRTEHLLGASPERNADLTRKVFGGTDPGADSEVVASIRLAVALNAAAALAAADSVDDPNACSVPLSDRINTHLPRAQAALDTGQAWIVCEKWIATAAQVKSAG
ncbi:MAG: anthranilate phosphoribosyltransferase [Candidatus Nanopelagicales bacterium]